MISLPQPSEKLRTNTPSGHRLTPVLRRIKGLEFLRQAQLGLSRDAQENAPVHDFYANGNSALQTRRPCHRRRQPNGKSVAAITSKRTGC